jgi:HEAT repeat protein
MALRDRDVEVRRSAALALGNIGGSDAVAALPILLDALAKGDPDMKRQSAAIIRNIGPDAFTAVHPLRKALTASDPELRANAAMALAGIGKAAESAVPDLVLLVANRNEASDVRVEAATALSRIGPVDSARDAVPKLLAVLEDTRNETRVRERIVWALRVHNVGLADLNVYPSFIKVLGEDKKKDTRMLRYDCAYMLGMLQGPSAPKEALAVLSDFLHDDSILIWKSREVKAGIGPEGQGGTIKGRDVGKGDGRVMAIQALDRICTSLDGNLSSQGVARVRAEKTVLRQLQTIAQDSNLDPELRKMTSGLLEKLK